MIHLHRHRNRSGVYHYLPQSTLLLLLLLCPLSIPKPRLLPQTHRWYRWNGFSHPPLPEEIPYHPLQRFHENTLHFFHSSKSRHHLHLRKKKMLNGNWFKDTVDLRGPFFWNFHFFFFWKLCYLTYSFQERFTLKYWETHELLTKTSLNWIRKRAKFWIANYNMST